MKKIDILQEVQQHYLDWNEDSEQRRNRENGWNDIIDAYNNVLPNDWPYLSRVVDPRIRTTLIEKKARLTNSKLRGRLMPREGGDILKAKINNAVLEYQWDTANEGGSMLSKFGTMDMDTRMFASSFAYVPWVYEVEELEEESPGKKEKKKVVRNGNGMIVLDPNNCGLDPNCTHIRDARWFQMREYVTLEDLEYENNYPGEAKYTGLKDLEAKISADTQNTRESDYQPRNLMIRGIEDRLGRDKAFPVIEIVTEFRKDRFITFSPKYNIVLRDIDNPYKHKSIPIIQLRYYPLLNDPIGESEVESVLPIWRAIQAVICSYMDTSNVHSKPPIKVVEGQARMETIQLVPDAIWVVNNPNAVSEHNGSGEALRYFQTSYSSLVAAFNTAMGDSSQGIGGIDPFNPQKTATEIKKQAAQQNVRDQDNQNALSDCLKDLMRMWVSNNQQFLFADPDMHSYVLRIVGSDMFEYFKRSGLDQMDVPQESMDAIKDIIDIRASQGDIVGEEELNTLFESAKVPLYPVVANPEVSNPNKQELKPKMEMSPLNDSAELTIIPEDLEGTYDYIPDIKSMASGSTEEQLAAQNQALTFMTNPTISQLLNMEGVQPNVKELVKSILENSGLRDADRYFTEAKAGPSTPENMQQQGLPGLSQAAPANPQQMAGPTQLQNSGGTTGGILPGMGGGAGL